MMPTRWRSLLALFAGTGAVVWGLVRIAEASGAVLPLLPLTAAASIAALGVAVLLAAVALRRRLRGLPGVKPPQPIGMARLAVLGKASSHVGAMLSGGYVGFVVALLADLDVSARRDRAIVAVLAATAAVLLLVAGLFLERLCRVPRAPDEQANLPDGSA